MATAQFVLETIPEDQDGESEKDVDNEEDDESEEDGETEGEKWTKIQDPAQLKSIRKYAKSNHTKALNRALLAVRLIEDVEQVKTLQGLMVREYDTLGKIRRRYTQLSNFEQEKSDREYDWADKIAKRQTNALRSLAEYLKSQKETDDRSSVSAKSSASSTLAKLQEAERLEKETELKIQQQRNVAAEQAAEEERIQQIESARKMEEKRIEAARKDRQLTMELEKQRLTGSLLRQQLQGESTDGQDNGRNQTLPNFDTTSRQNIPLAPTRPPATPAPSRFTTPTFLTFLKHEPAVPQPSFTPFSSFNVNAPGLIPSFETGQQNASINQPFQTNNRSPFLPPAALYRSSTPRIQSGIASGSNPFMQQQSSFYTPDAWIFTIDRHDSPPTSRPSSRPPKAEPPKFDGNPRNWPMFIQSFKVQIHDTCSSDAERQHHLRTSLSSEIQNQLGETLLNPGLYPFALKELHRKFGNARIVSTACSSSLLKLPSFRDSDYDSLKSFSSTLHSVVATLQLGGYGSELQSSTTLAQLVGKLPPNLRSK
jgi:hypothetical protein